MTKLLDDICEENDIDSSLMKFFFNNKINYENSIDYYFSLLKDIPILNKEEEQELFLKYLNGDKKARVKLILCNFKLVISIVNKYMRKDMIVDDMIQEGLIGLIKAVDDFDISKNFKFSTYASWWIKKYVLTFIRNNSIISISQYGIDKIKTVHDAIEQLKNKKINPTVENIATLTNLSKEKVIKSLEISSKTVSLNDNVTDDSELLLGDILFSTENVEEQVEQKNKINDLKELLQISNLIDEEMKVLFLKYGFLGNPKQNSEIASLMNIKKNRVMTLETKGLKKIRLSPYLKDIVEILGNEQGRFVYVKR